MIEIITKYTQAQINMICEQCKYPVEVTAWSTDEVPVPLKNEDGSVKMKANEEEPEEFIGRISKDFTLAHVRRTLIGMYERDESATERADADLLAAQTDTK